MLYMLVGLARCICWSFSPGTDNYRPFSPGINTTGGILIMFELTTEELRGVSGGWVSGGSRASANGGDGGGGGRGGRGGDAMGGLDGVTGGSIIGNTANTNAGTGAVGGAGGVGGKGGTATAGDTTGTALD
jgi:hypothetical protein